jgi:hypothetical protein
LDRQDKLLEECEGSLRDSPENDMLFIHPDRISRVQNTVSCVGNLEQVAAVPRNFQQDARLPSHPASISRAPVTVPSISNPNLGSSDSARRLHIVTGTIQFIKKSRKDRKALRNQVYPLSRTRSGKFLIKPLLKGQCRYLQCIPKDMISQYLEERK